MNRWPPGCPASVSTWAGRATRCAAPAMAMWLRCETGGSLIWTRFLPRCGCCRDGLPPGTEEALFRRETGPSDGCVHDLEQPEKSSVSFLLLRALIIGSDSDLSLRGR